MVHHENPLLRESVCVCLCLCVYANDLSKQDESALGEDLQNFSEGEHKKIIPSERFFKIWFTECVKFNNTDVTALFGKYAETEHGWSSRSTEPTADGLMDSWTGNGCDVS